MKKIKVSQGMLVKGVYTQPTFPITDKNVNKMLKEGIAEVTNDIRAKYGSGIYEKIEGEWVCISSKWDTSG